MRKNFILVVIFVVFLSSNASASPVLSIGNYNTTSLGILPITISISDISSEVIKDFSFALEISPSNGNLIIPVLDNFTPGPAVPAPSSFYGYRSDSYTFLFFYSAPTPATPNVSNGNLASLDLSILAYGSWDLTLTDLAFGAGMNTVIVDAVNGSVNASAVPIPAAAWLLGSGLLGLVALRRRMRN